MGLLKVDLAGQVVSFVLCPMSPCLRVFGVCAGRIADAHACREARLSARL